MHFLNIFHLDKKQKQSPFGQFTHAHRVHSRAPRQGQDPTGPHGNKMAQAPSQHSWKQRDPRYPQSLHLCVFECALMFSTSLLTSNHSLQEIQIKENPYNISSCHDEVSATDARTGKTNPKTIKKHDRVERDLSRFHWSVGVMLWK